MHCILFILLKPSSTTAIKLQYLYTCVITCLATVSNIQQPQELFSSLSTRSKQELNEVVNVWVLRHRYYTNIVWWLFDKFLNEYHVITVPDSFVQILRRGRPNENWQSKLTYCGNLTWNTNSNQKARAFYTSNSFVALISNSALLSNKGHN